jgi:hypothetical protein
LKEERVPTQSAARAGCGGAPHAGHCQQDGSDVLRARDDGSRYLRVLLESAMLDFWDAAQNTEIRQGGPR